MNSANSYFLDNADLIGWQTAEFNSSDFIEPVKPKALHHEQWPPDYRGIIAWRKQTLELLQSDERMLQASKAYYSTRPTEFIMHWMDTYNPRKKTQKWMPFVFFKKQEEFIEYLHELRNAGESGLVEKCRDVGMTWCAVGYSAWSFIFVDDDAIGWGSRKQDLVDKIGDPDSIFEKFRLIVSRIPNVFLPNHINKFQTSINHDTGAIVSGEAGDNIGRGGRKSIYFKDESAHYERPENIEAALGENTDVQIDISSVNGLGNVFHRRREAGVIYRKGEKLQPGYTQVFIVDWRDHPEKDQTWYDTKRAKYEREGLLHVFKQEVERDYSGAVSNTIIPYEWITKCVDAHKFIKWKDQTGVIRQGLTDEQIGNNWAGGLDLADEGIDRNASSLRQGIVWRDVDEWTERDVGVSTRKMIMHCKPYKGIKVYYDIIGMGSSVKSEFNRLVQDEKIITKEDINLIGWNAGAGVLNPFDNIVVNDDTSPLNKDLYANLKAQAWNSLRQRFYKTFKNITEGVLYPIDEMISLDSRMTLLHQLMKELAQPTRGENGQLKEIVNKKPDGMKSPNLADAGIQMYFPIEDKNYAITGKYGG